MRKFMQKLIVTVLAAAMAVSAFAFAGCGEKLKITPAELEMEQYETATLSLNKDGAAVWSSSDPSVVRVENGKVTSLKMGSSVISAVVGEETASCEITVVKATKSRSLVVSESEVEMHLGVVGEDEKTLTASLKESGADLNDVEYIWTSSSTSVAKVTDGVVTALNSGKTTITVSTRYKGQSFAKEIPVTVRDYKTSVKGMAFVESAVTGATLGEYDGDVTSLGFESGTVVTEYTVTDSADPSAIKILAADALKDGAPAFDRMVFDMKLSAPFTGDLVIQNYGTYTYTAGIIPVLGLDYGVVVFDKATGEVHKGALSADKIYTFVVNFAAKENDTEKAFGISVSENTTVYFANVVCCNGDYYEDNFTDLKKPAEPYTKGIYIAQNDADIHPATVDDGWYKQVYDGTNLWGDRMFLGNEEWTVIYNYTAMKERFDYMGFEFKFDGSCAGAIWTGGYALMLSADGTFTKEGGGAIADGDIYIYDASGKYVTGKKLHEGEVYSVKIKIQKEEDGVYQNLSTGFALNSGTLYIRNPYFIAQDTPDLIPEEDPRTYLPKVVCNDNQTELAKSTETGYTDWYEQTFTSGNLWTGRLYGFDSDISFIAMRQFDYYGFDIIFRDTVDGIVIWNGDSTATAEDYTVYDENGTVVTGALSVNVKYTFRIKVKGVDSNVFGLAISCAGEATAKVLVSKPFLEKAE